MQPLCFRCAIKEEYIASMTIDECKSRCLSNPNCVAIDFGRGSEKEQYCYLNYESTDFDNDDSFDAWEKTTVCGN